MRIGVLADTHIPGLLPDLPPRVFEVFKGVDIILHAGDICELSVLQQLEPIAQTFAVYGNRDTVEVRHFLQESQRLEFDNRAVGLVHGHRAWEGGMLARGRYLFDTNARMQALYSFVLRQFPNVHAVVFGHSHQPYMKMHGGVLLFNPGAVCPTTGQRASVGILEIRPNSIKGRLVPL